MEANLNQFHLFGSPVYVLGNSLQSQKSHNKWSDQARVGICMCHSTHHSTSVPLVLNNQSGNFSPQFHCIYDDDLNTCKRDLKFVSWSMHKILMINPVVADLPCIRALNSRKFFLSPSVFYHLGQEKCIIDDAFHLFYLSDTAFLTETSDVHSQLHVSRKISLPSP